MSRTKVEPYEVSKPSRREGDRVTATIEVIVPLNYLSGSMKFSLRYTTWLANDFCYGVDGPHVSTQQDQYLDQEQCAPVLAFLDDTITDNISSCDILILHTDNLSLKLWACSIFLNKTKK